MGFRNGAYAKVWEITPKTNSITNVRLSISRKDSKTKEYVQDFSGFVDFIGSATAQKILNVKIGSTIKLGDTDVSTNFSKESNKTFINYKVFSFDTVSNDKANPATQKPTVDDGEIDAVSEEPLPF